MGLLCSLYQDHAKKLPSGSRNSQYILTCSILAEQAEVKASRGNQNSTSQSPLAIVGRATGFSLG